MFDSGVSSAAKIGRLEGLRALRDHLAAAVDDCDSKRDLAALSQRLMDVLEQIDGLAGSVADSSPADEIAARRRMRGA